jgi:glycosyltransferase involved in cell wall biosynthesis
MGDYVITLSSIPPRFSGLDSTLKSLLAQTVKPARVILYLNRHYRRFPDWDGRLPDVPEGVEIRLVDEDFGPATKVLPALREFAGQDMDILFCDDDQIYRPRIAERLLKARAKRPNDCIAINPMADFLPPEGETRRKGFRRPKVLRLWKITHVPFHLRRHWRRLVSWITGRPYADPPRRLIMRAGYADAFEGWTGVLVRPEFFPEEVFDIPDFAWPVDDVWLSGHAARMGHPAWIIGGPGEPFLMPEHKDAHLSETALHNQVFAGSARDESNNTAVRYFQETYGIWR